MAGFARWSHPDFLAMSSTGSVRRDLRWLFVLDQPTMRTQGSWPLPLNNRGNLDCIRLQRTVTDELRPGRERGRNVDKLDRVGIVGIVDLLERTKHLIEQLTDGLMPFLDTPFEHGRMAGQ